jgi:hypothetical protein
MATCNCTTEHILIYISKCETIIKCIVARTILRTQKGVPRINSYHTSLKLFPHVAQQMSSHLVHLGVGSNNHAITVASNKHSQQIGMSKRGPERLTTVRRNGKAFVCCHLHHPWNFFLCLQC